MYVSYEVAGPLGVGSLIASAACVLTRRRFGYVFALVGTLLEGAYLYRFYPYRYSFSPWLTFNLPYDRQYSRGYAPATITILAVASVVTAAAFSVERLMPSTWHIGKAVLQDRAWPAFGVAFLFVFGWYLEGVMPYRTPIISDGIRPIIWVWHVEKHGLQFHETSIAFYRDSQFWLAEDNHRLFQYSFRTSESRGLLTNDYFGLLNGLADSPPAFRGTLVSHYSPPITWNAERWYVVYYGRTRSMPIRVELSTMPREPIVNLFYGALRLPKEQERRATARDVCFGFCYGPEN